MVLLLLFDSCHSSRPRASPSPPGSGPGPPRAPQALLPSFHLIVPLFLRSLCWLVRSSSYCCCIILLSHGFGGSEIQEGLVWVVLALDVFCGFCRLVAETATAGPGVAGGSPGAPVMGFWELSPGDSSQHGCLGAA